MILSPEKFITFKQAAKLKKLGFRWPCCYYYTDEGEMRWHHPDSKANRDSNGHHPTRLSAPTLSEAREWLLRKGVAIDLYEGMAKKYERGEMEWEMVFRYRLTTFLGSYNHIVLDYSSPTDALYGAIDMALEYLESENDKHI